MNTRRPRLRCALFAGLLLLSAPAVVRAQRATLAEKLRKLNVRHVTEHYMLAGTVTGERLAQYGDALEYIHREYERGFRRLLADLDGGPRRRQAVGDPRKQRGRRAVRRVRPNTRSSMRTLADAGEEERFRVIVFARRAEYRAFGDTFLGGNEFTVGMFLPRHDLLLIQDKGSLSATTEVLFHEAFHQFMHRYVNKAPIWLNEGLATHYGYARLTPQGLTFHRPPANYWKLVRELMETRQCVPLWQVVSADRHTFYDRTTIKVGDFGRVQRRSIFYGEAYTLLHMLLSDDAGRERLQDYIRDLARAGGRKRAQITRRYFGPEVCERMTPFWIRYVRSRPETR